MGNKNRKTPWLLIIVGASFVSVVWLAGLTFTPDALGLTTLEIIGTTMLVWCSIFGVLYFQSGTTEVHPNHD